MVTELLDLSGRKALVTGAGGRLGLRFAQTLSELGAYVILSDICRDSLAQTASSLPGPSSSEHVDLESEKSIQGLIETVNSHHDELHILVNCAAFVGTSAHDGWSVPFEEQSLTTWRRALEVNLTACFHLAQGLAPILKKTPKSCIVNIGSIYGVVGPDLSLYEGTSLGNPAAYATSKGGLIQLTRWLATVLAPEVRVNCISPGGVAAAQASDFVSRYEKRTPLRRMAQASDVRGALAFLASDLSQYVTGQNLLVDGGWTAW